MSKNEWCLKCKNTRVLITEIDERFRLEINIESGEASPMLHKKVKARCVHCDQTYWWDSYTKEISIRRGKK